MQVRRHYHAHEVHITHAFMRALIVIFMMIALLVLGMWIVGVKYAQEVARDQPLVPVPRSQNHGIPLETLPGQTPAGVISLKFHSNT